MTVEELIEELRALPPTAPVEVQIRMNETAQCGSLEALYDYRPAAIDTVVYSLGRVVVQLDE